MGDTPHLRQDPTGPTAAAPLKPPSMPDLQLREIDPDDYEILTEHGRGGMGRVMVARDRRLDRLVAIKELLTPDSHVGRRFVREALLTARLQHPSIVPVHEAGRWPTGKPFYAMKLVYGRPLADLILESKTLTARMALLRYLTAVADAVAYAHSKHIIHRDLKPANVLVGSFGETVVIDWGLAKELGVQDPDSPSQPRQPNETMPPPRAGADLMSGSAGSPSGLNLLETQEGAVVGTPGYMSPEQARGDSCDERSDVYAIGAMLYTLLAGRVPYDAKNLADLMELVKHSSPIPLAEREKAIPAELVTIVEKAMARRPEDRYPTAKELAEDLRRFETGQLVRSHVYSWTELVKRWLHRHRLVVGVAAVALAVLVAGGVVSVINIVEARNRAQTARAREAQRVDELTLSQARTLLDSDPTAAMAWLKRLRPGDAGVWRAARLVAFDALARGVARRTLEVPDDVAALEVSPDGRWVAAVLEDGALKVWDADSGQARPLDGGGRARGIAFSGDGAHLLSGGPDGARVWDLASGRAQVLRDAGAVSAVAFTKDGTRVATAGEAGGVKVWDAATGAPLAGFQGDVRARQLAFAAGGALVARGAASLWVLDAGGAPRTLVDDANRLSAFALDGDGGVMAAAVGDEIRVWNVVGGEVATTVTMPGALMCAVSPDGMAIAGAAADGEVRLWTLRDGGDELLSHIGEDSKDLRFSPDGRWLVATRSTMARVWSLDTRDIRKLRGHSLDVMHIALSGSRLATASIDRTIRVWSLDAGSPTAVRVSGKPDDLSVTPVDPMIAASDAHGLTVMAGADRLRVDGARLPTWSVRGELAFVKDGHVSLWRRGDKEPAVLDGGGTSVVHVAWGPSGQLAAGSSDGTVRRWDHPTGAPVASERAHEGAVTDLAFLDGETIVSGGEDGAVRVGARTLSPHGARILHVAVNGLYGHIAACAAGGDVILWSDAGKTGRVVASAPGGCTGLGFSADGSALAVASPEMRGVTLVTVASGEARFLAERDGVRDLAVVSGDLVATAGAGVTIHDLAGLHAMPLLAKGARVRSITSADSILAVGSDDGWIRVYRVDAPNTPADLRSWLDGVTAAVAE